MRWDEDRFRVRRTDLFNIKLVDDFNMGAMENKSLNLFNSRLVLATPESATDTARAHRGRHRTRVFPQLDRNRGRVATASSSPRRRASPCSATRSSPPTCPRPEVSATFSLRDAQFAEDASLMAHPVRPASYMKIDNYTPP